VTDVSLVSACTSQSITHSHGSARVF